MHGGPGCERVGNAGDDANAGTDNDDDDSALRPNTGVLTHIHEHLIHDIVPNAASGTLRLLLLLQSILSNSENGLVFTGRRHVTAMRQDA